MATEIRRIIFSNAEIMQALSSYIAKNKVDFPEGKIVRSSISNSKNIKIDALDNIGSEILNDYNLFEDNRIVTFTMFCDGSFEQRYFNLPATFISAALIEYCLSQGIMLPKDSKKMLAVTDFSICLDINKDNFTEGDQEDDRLTLED